MSVTVINAHPRYRCARSPIAACVRTALRRGGRGVHTVTVVLHDNRGSRTLNAQWLGHRGPTDVISFLLERKDPLEGEIYVNLDRARLQADAYGVRFGSEVARLAIHGALHLTGMNDRTPAQRTKMHRREDEVLARFF